MQAHLKILIFSVFLDDLLLDKLLFFTKHFVIIIHVIKEIKEKKCQLCITSNFGKKLECRHKCCGIT